MIQDDIAKTCIQLLLKEPFFGHFLSQIVRAPSDQIETIGIQALPGEVFQLLVNESYWGNQLYHEKTDKRHALRTGAIKHQILHLMFGHLWKVHEVKNKRIFGIAADLVVNQYLTSDQLTEDAITPDKFPDLDIPIQQSVFGIYKLLENYFDEASDNFETLNASQEYLLDLVLNEHLLLEEHHIWEKQLYISSVGKKMINDWLDELLINSKNRTNPQHYGKLPSSLKALIKQLEIQRSATLDWRRILKLFAATSRKTYLKNTIRRPSKRYGTSPGISLKRKQQLLVVLDTSASIQVKDLQMFFQEIHLIWKAGAEILILECDTVIHDQYRYKGYPPSSVKGRGGTGFDAALEFANSFLPDAVVYFTDGFAPSPTVNCRKPILWLLTSNGIKPEDAVWGKLPGRKVRM